MVDVIKDKEVEAKASADFGNPLLDKYEDHHYEACKAFLSEDLPYYMQRIQSLAGRPEAAEFFAWMKEQAKDGEENPLFRVLCHEA